MKRGVDRRGFLKKSAMTGAALMAGSFLGEESKMAHAANRDEIALPRERVPVTMAADVVVVGGGPGGFAAALRAARDGASVILIEKFGMPGGVHTSGLQGAAGPGVGGIHTELMKRFAEEGQIYTFDEKTHPDWTGNPLSHYESQAKSGSSFKRATFNPEGAGNLMSRMLDEAGVKVMYTTTFLDVVTKKLPKEKIEIRSVIVQNASGTQAIKGRVFIDGSGTAEVAARAGAPFVRGGGPQPSTVQIDNKRRPIPGGLLWIMTGIDYEELVRYQKHQDDSALSRLISAALSAGDIPHDLFRPRLSGTCVYATSYIGHPTLDMSPILGPGTFIFWQNVPYEWALHLDDNAQDATRGQAAMRAFVEAEAKFLKKYVPGFKKAFITNVGSYLGIRDGRHPTGEYVLTMDDALTGRRFPDAVTAPMKKVFFWDCNKPHEFQVPYRCFLPKKVTNLLLTGASLSFSYETLFMVMRNFPWCTQTGEIAGFAAAKSVAQGIPPSQYKWATPMF